MSPPRPSLRAEKALLRAGRTAVAGVDEVGRGAPAGPVTCGVVVVDATVGPVPVGLRDSKLLTPAARRALVDVVDRWCLDHAVGHASAAEVDALGLTAALGLAGVRALGALSVRPDAVLLDGSHDWLGPPDGPGGGAVPPVTTRVRADQTCASVAAASVLAKVARDGIMVDLDGQHPGYGWAANKGYGTGDHLAGVERLGLTVHHRHTWRFGTGDPDGTGPPGRQDR